MAPELVRLCKQMRDETVYKGADFQPDQVVALASNPAVFCALYKHLNKFVGVVAGYVSKQVFGNDIVANDLVLYVEPEGRKSRAAVSLIRQFEAWAKEHGAKSVYMTSSSGMLGVEKIFNRFGYDTVGVVTRKEI
jgi:N-acetylglutamate synthase-like GNAT family acetyltransferase